MIKELSKLHEHLAVRRILQYGHSLYHLQAHLTGRRQLKTIVQGTRIPA